MSASPRARPAGANTEILTPDLAWPASATRALERRCADLERRLADLSAQEGRAPALSADAAHDLRGPLQGIAGLIELIIGHNSGGLDQKTQEMLGLILGSIGGLAELIDAASEHTRHASGPFDPTVVDVAQLASTALGRLAPQVAQTGARVEVLDLPTLRADPGLLTRALELIVGRALSAGGRCVVVSSRRTPAGWVLSVVDDGEPLSAQERVLKIFGRSGRPGTDRRLAIAVAVAERHGGSLRADPLPGAGTRVSLYLPDPG